MINIVGGTFILIGAILALIASLGMLRMPDLLMRMHAGTKAGTLSVSLILLAAGFEFNSLTAWIKVFITILFLFITLPIGAHILARAAYFINIPLSDTTAIDELRDHYDKNSHELR